MRCSKDTGSGKFNVKLWRLPEMDLPILIYEEVEKSINTWVSRRTNVSGRRKNYNPEGRLKSRNDCRVSYPR
jgi:hypothetical protein